MIVRNPTPNNTSEEDHAMNRPAGLLSLIALGTVTWVACTGVDADDVSGPLAMTTTLASPSPSPSPSPKPGGFLCHRTAATITIGGTLVQRFQLFRNAATIAAHVQAHVGPRQEDFFLPASFPQTDFGCSQYAAQLGGPPAVLRPPHTGT